MPRVSNTRRLAWMIFVVVSLTLHAQNPPPGWQMVWDDEFNGPSNSPIDSAKWNFDVGYGMWGNGELETYCGPPGFPNNPSVCNPDQPNAFIDGMGNLVISTFQIGLSNTFTSARMRTGKIQSIDTANNSWEYGIIEARIMLPFASGVWPAFWMMGADYEWPPPGVGWPTCGEIDIMENFGSNTDQDDLVHGTIHGPIQYRGQYLGPYQVGGSFLVQGTVQEYHIYSIEWSPNLVQFFVDGILYQSFTPTSIPPGGTWEFNQPFYVILNVAIGGTAAGPPIGTQFPQQMLVDYVRVYQPNSFPEPPAGLTAVPQ